MTDAPASEWLTYQQAADRLGLRTPNAAAARARRGKWPKRIRNTNKAAEILVPGELLATGQKRPAEPRLPPAPTSDAPTLADAVRTAVAPLEAALERQDSANKVLQAALDVARAEIAAAQLEATKADMMRLAAEKGSDDLARRLEREESDRQTLQRQTDDLRAELHAALAEAARNHGENRSRREAAEGKVADLERRLAEVTAKKARRWWQF